MSNEITTANAEAAQSSVESGNISAEQYMLSRMKAKTPPPKEESKPQQKPEAKPEDVEADNQEPNGEPDESSQDEPKDEPKEVLSKDLDLESMSEVELRELAEKLGSRAVARFGELTAKRKAAEEQLETLKAELAKRQAPDPLAAPKKDATNPYKSIQTVAELQSKASEVEEVIEWAEETLWSNDHLAADDIVATVEGKELTKAQVRKALRDAQKARKEHLPAQLAALQAKEQRKALKNQLTERARTEIGWLDKEDDDVRKHYDNLISDPRIKQAVESVPDLEPFMEYMVAHAANSIYARKPVPMDTPKRPQVTPPESPGSTAAQTERPEGRSVKQIKEAEQRLQKTGAISDFIALRQQQHSKRKSI
jgi:hypothetical protein